MSTAVETPSQSTFDEKAFLAKFPYKLQPTNLKGVYITPAPPDTFDPQTASQTEHSKIGLLWRKPDASEPRLKAAWDKFFSRKWLAKDRIVPEMHPQIGRTHNLKVLPKKVTDTSYLGGVWANVLSTKTPEELDHGHRGYPGRFRRSPSLLNRREPKADGTHPPGSVSTASSSPTTSYRLGFNSTSAPAESPLTWRGTSGSPLRSRDRPRISFKPTSPTSPSAPGSRSTAPSSTSTTKPLPPSPSPTRPQASTSPSRSLLLPVPASMEVLSSGSWKRQTAASLARLCRSSLLSPSRRPSHAVPTTPQRTRRQATS